MPNGAKRYCFTWNNWADHCKDAEERLEAWADEKCVFAIWGKEKAPSTGTPHLQGFWHATVKKTIKQIAKMFPGISVYIAKGSDEENRVYCSKGTDVREFGEPTVPDRSFKELAQEAAKMSNPLDGLAAIEKEMPHVLMQSRNIKMYFLDKIKPYAGKRTVVWLWGPTGTGKTARAFAAGCEKAKYLKGGFWEMPAGAEKVYIDEVDKIGIPLVELLEVLHEYPTRVNTKHGSQAWTAKTIYFTSSTRPQEIYPDEEGQLMRRIDECVYSLD